MVAASHTGACVCAHRHEKIDFWEDVYGFNMGAIRALAMAEPLVDCVDAEQVATRPALLATFNLASMTQADAAFSVRAPPSPQVTTPGPTASVLRRLQTLPRALTDHDRLELTPDALNTVRTASDTLN